MNSKSLLLSTATTCGAVDLFVILDTYRVKSSADDSHSASETSCGSFTLIAVVCPLQETYEYAVRATGQNVTNALPHTFVVTVTHYGR